MRTYFRHLALFSIPFLCLFYTKKATAQCKSNCVVINEVQANPVNGNASGGEWTELYNTCPTPADISCYVITSGSFYVTFPTGTIIPPNGYLTIGNSLSPGTVDINTSTCNCAGSNGLGGVTGVYTDAKQQAVFTDPSGSVLDAIFWGGGNNYGTITVPATASCGSVSVTIPPISSYPALGSQATGSGRHGWSIARQCDGSATWIETASYTFGTSNGTAPHPNFIASDSVFCSGTCINFTDKSTGSISSYSWAFNGASTTTSAATNPTNICYNTTKDTAFDVKLSVTNTCGTFSYTKPCYIHLTTGGTPTISANGPTTFCSGGSVVLQTGSMGNLQWNMAGNPINGATNKQYTATAAGNYTLTVSGGTCGNGTTTAITVTISPAMALTVKPADTTICSGFSVQLMALGSGTFAWSPKTTLNDSTIATPLASPLVTTTYTVTGDACTTPGTAIINVGSNATGGGHLTALRDTICEGTAGSLTLTGNASNTLQWRSSINGTDFTDISNVIDTDKYRTTPLQQSTFYMVAVGTGSCSAYSDTLELIVPPSLTASFTSATTDKTVTFNSTSEGNITTYFWDFGDGANSPEQNPSHTFAKDTVYYVCLTIYDGSNCSYTFCRTIDLTTGVVNIDAASSFNVYPTPFGNDLNIDAKALDNHVLSIEMYDVLGRIALSKVAGNTNNSTFQLNTSTLAKGMYYLQIKTANAAYIQKVIKQ